jgi:hypothetical protein
VGSQRLLHLLELFLQLAYLVFLSAVWYGARPVIAFGYPLSRLGQHAQGEQPAMGKPLAEQQ